MSKIIKYLFNSSGEDNGLLDDTEQIKQQDRQQYYTYENNTSELRNKEFTIMSLNSELVELKKKNATLINENKNIKTNNMIEIDFLNNDIIKLKTIIASLSVNNNTTNNNNCNNNSTSIEKELIILKKENSELKQNNDALINEVNKLQAEFNKLKNMLSSENNTSISDSLSSNSVQQLFLYNDYINLVSSLSKMSYTELYNIINDCDLKIFSDNNKYKLQLTFLYSLCKKYYLNYVLKENSVKIYGITDNNNIYKLSLEDYFIQNVYPTTQTAFLNNDSCISELYMFFNNFITHYSI